MSKNENPVVFIKGGDCDREPFVVGAQRDTYSNEGKGSRTEAVRFYGELSEGREPREDGRPSPYAYNYCFAATIDELIEKFTALGFDIKLKEQPEPTVAVDIEGEQRLAEQEEASPLTTGATTREEFEEDIDHIPVGQSADYIVERDELTQEHYPERDERPEVSVEGDQPSDG